LFVIVHLFWKSFSVKNIFLAIFLLLFSSAIPVAAADLLVVQSLQIKPYDDALQGFKSACSGKINRIISSELTDADVGRKIRKVKPDLILAIGMDALSKIREVRDVPIVYVMVLNPPAEIADSSNATGVSMYIQPEYQFATIRRVLPSVKRLGLLFDQDRSGGFVRKAQLAAAAAGIELLSRRVSSASEAVTSVGGLKGKVDALWLIPDMTVVTSKSSDLLLLSAIEKRIPVLVFSAKYMDKGALLSLEVDPVESGRQAGELASRILVDGIPVKDIKGVDARSGILTINKAVAKQLGIILGSAVLSQAAR
jgi:ABC-type uncharacterized transport system substrate-binding protein